MSSGSGGLSGGEAVPEVVQENLKFEQLDVISILAGDTLANLKILKRWNVVPDPNEELPNTPIEDFAVWALGQRLTGVGSIRFGIYRSIDNGATWIEDNITSFGALGFLASFTDGHRGGLGTTATDLAIGARNTDGATTGEVKNVKASLRLDFPIGMKFVEV